MARTRKRDWPQKVWRFWIKPDESWLKMIPDTMREEAFQMNRLWNQLTETMNNVEIPTDKAEKIAFYKEKQATWNQLEKESTCYWCNSESVLSRFETTIRSKKRPTFHAFDGNWTFVHRFTGGGRPIENLFSEKKLRVAIRPLGQDAYDPLASQRENRRKSQTEIIVNIAGEALIFKTILHRQFPLGSFLKRVEIVRKYAAGQEKWHICFTIEFPMANMAKKENRTVASLELGYRKINGRIRFGVLDAGSEPQELFLPGNRDFAFLESIKYIEQLQTRSDNLLEEIKPMVKSLLENISENNESAQKLLKNWHMARQKRIKHIFSLLRDTGTSDEKLIPIKQYFQRSRRFQQEINGNTRRLINRRNWYYSNFIKKMVEEYEFITVKHLELKKFAEESPSSKEYALKKSGHARQWAGLSEFVRILKYKAQENKTEIIWASPYTTITCHKCGKDTAVEDRSHKDYVCLNCGESWDQDHNAAANMMKISKIQGDFVQSQGLRKFLTRTEINENYISNIGSSYTT